MRIIVLRRFFTNSSFKFIEQEDVLTINNHKWCFTLNLLSIKATLRSLRRLYPISLENTHEPLCFEFFEAFMSSLRLLIVQDMCENLRINQIYMKISTKQLSNIVIPTRQ